MTLHGAIAEAVVLIRADGSTLEKDVSGHAARAGETAGARMGHSLTSTFSKIAGSVLIAEGVKSAIEYADAFEKSRSRLEVITHNIGGNFDELQGHVEMLDQKMATLGFTNADVEGSLASLETATKNPTLAMRDLGLAADIARGRNIGLEESTRILMRVETGHVAMLSKLGIQTKDANGHLLTQQEALVALAKTYGGAASHYAGTFAGKQEALSASLKNSAAEIGVSLLPALVSMAGVLQRDVIPIVVNTTHWFERNQETIKPIAAVILTAVGAWKAYVLWTRLAAASTALFGRAAGGATVGLAAEATAARVTAGSAVGAGVSAGAVASTASAGAVIGGGMAAKMNTANVTLATNALTAAKNVGLMGGAALGIANLISNPRSLGFPMGFNKDQMGSNTVLPYNPKAPPVSSAPAGTKATGIVGVEFLPQVKAVHALASAHADNATSTLDDVFAQKQAIVTSRAMVVATNATDHAQARATARARDAAAAEKLFAQNVRQLTATLETHATRMLAATGSYDAFRQLLNDLPQSVKANGRALSGFSDKAIANRQALGSAAQAIFAHIDAMKAQHRSATAVNASLLDMEHRLRAQASATFGSRAAVDAFLRKLGLLPGQARAALAGLSGAGKTGGMQLGAGLVAGMQAEQHAVSVQAKIIADQAVKGIRLGIQPGSPSKVTRKLGQQAGDGLVAGMKDREAAVQKQAQILASKIANIRSSAQQLASSISGTMTGAAALTNTPNQTAGGIAAFLRHQVVTDRAFQRGLRRLQHEGYDRRLISELAQEGPEAAGNIVKQLAGASRAQRDRINRFERDIYGISARTGKQVRQEIYSPQLDKLHTELHTLTETVQHLEAEIRGAQHKSTARTGTRHHR